MIALKLKKTAGSCFVGLGTQRNNSSIDVETMSKLLNRCQFEMSFFYVDRLIISYWNCRQSVTLFWLSVSLFLRETESQNNVNLTLFWLIILTYDKNVMFWLWFGQYDVKWHYFDFLFSLGYDDSTMLRYDQRRPRKVRTIAISYRSRCSHRRPSMVVGESRTHCRFVLGWKVRDMMNGGCSAWHLKSGICILIFPSCPTSRSHLSELQNEVMHESMWCKHAAGRN